MSAVDIWNAIGTWVGGLGSLSAAAAAVWIAIRDGRERDAARPDDEAAKARTLTVETGHLGSEVISIKVTNHGTLPMLAIHLERIVISPDDAGPGSRQTIEDEAQAVLPPGGTMHASVDVMAQQGGQFCFEEPYSIMGVVAYRDAAGRAWRRWGNTDPQRIVKAAETKRPIPDQGHKIVEVQR